MTEKLAYKLSICFVKNDIIPEDKRELLEYSVFHILSSILHVLLLLAAGIVFSLVFEIAVFALFFCSLKRYIGGAHATKHRTCLLSFTLLALAGAWFGSLFSEIPALRCLPVILTVTAALLILWKAPVLHPNAPRRNVQALKKFKKKAAYIAAIQIITALAVCLFRGFLSPLLFSGSLGSISAAITLLLPVPDTTGKGGAENE